MNHSTPHSKNRIILPLDFPSFSEAKPLVTSLKNHVGLFKVGLTLFFKEGLSVIHRIEDLTGRSCIFLDLKLYDTPMQVGRAATVLRDEVPEVRFLTVHTSGGVRVLRSVVEAMSGGTGILGVTALTSLSAGESSDTGNDATLQNQVLKLSGVAQEAGARGVVASAHEAKQIKAAFGKELLVVTPGIRPAWSDVSQDDQRRVMSPKEAIQASADYLVIGRPIYGNKDPLGAAEKIAAEIEEAESSISS